MTTQQPEALRLANILRGIDARSLFANEKLSAASAALENQHARITELESQLAQRFAAADMATASAQGFRDGVASLAANAGSKPVAHSELFDYLRTELSAIPCRYRGDPEYDHDAYWMRDKAEKLLDEAERIFAHPSPPEGMVMAPKVPTVEMKVAAVKYANGTAVYKNVKAEVLRIEEDIYGEVYEAMIAAAPATADGESNELS